MIVEYRFENGFYDLSDIPKKFQLKRPNNGSSNTYSVIWYNISNKGTENTGKVYLQYFKNSKKTDTEQTIKNWFLSQKTTKWMRHEKDEKRIKPSEKKDRIHSTIKTPTSCKELKPIFGATKYIAKLLPKPKTKRKRTKRKDEDFN